MAGKAFSMAVETPQVHRERALRALRRRLRPWVRRGGQLIWTATCLLGGGIALAEGDHRTAIIGFAAAGVFLALTLLGTLRRRRLRRRSWRAS